MHDKIALTAPCGIDCFNCEIHESNITNEIAQVLAEKCGVPEETIACKGCRQEDGKHFHLPSNGCATLNCVKAKGVDLCCDCDEFPCGFLAPVAEGAERFPHNMKVYNLCRIKLNGLEGWIEEAAHIRKRYFTGKFGIGKGQTE